METRKFLSKIKYLKTQESMMSIFFFFALARQILCWSIAPEDACLCLKARVVDMIFDGKKIISIRSQESLIFFLFFPMET